MNRITTCRVAFNTHVLKFAQRTLCSGAGVKLPGSDIDQVGADGSKSRVRELAGIDTTGWKYSQNAIICTLEHTVKNGGAWQRFLPHGPISFLPIGGNFSNIVWSWTMNLEESSDRKSMYEDYFVKEVNRALDDGYGPHPESLLFGGKGMVSWLTAEVTTSGNECFEVPPKAFKLASE